MRNLPLISHPISTTVAFVARKASKIPMNHANIGEKFVKFAVLISMNPNLHTVNIVRRAGISVKFADRS